MSQNNQEVRKRFQNGKIALDRRDIEIAISNTKSNKSAARYLGISFVTYKKIASTHLTEDGTSLYENHCNKYAIGIPKYANRSYKKTVLLDILEGRIDKTFTSMKEIKNRIISEGLMKEECSRCAFNEKRVLDLKVPLIVNYLDTNKKNWRLENLEFLCYNCFFLYIGDVFLKKQIEAMEDINATTTKNPIDFELPRTHSEDIKASINLENKYIKPSESFPDNFGDDLIVSIKKVRNG